MMMLLRKQRKKERKGKAEVRPFAASWIQSAVKKIGY
jgi:hypothetical protein